MPIAQTVRKHIIGQANTLIHRRYNRSTIPLTLSSPDPQDHSRFAKAIRDLSGRLADRRPSISWSAALCRRDAGEYEQSSKTK